MATWITTQKGNLVNLDQCISVFVEHVPSGERPWALKADVVAGPGNPIFVLARFTDEAGALAALDAVRVTVSGTSVDLRST